MADALLPSDLLAHAAFARSLARVLVGDDDAADDAAQDALVRALERPPRERGALRAWLATVVRRGASNARRGASRRRRREESVARGEGLPSAADLAARAEILEVVGAAVRALDPAARRLVLLRHYEGLPPREIAARTGESVETVRAGLARAHARLRARLAQDERGNVGGWRSALAGLVGLPAVTKTGAPVGGGIAVTTATKAGIGLAAAACLAGGVWWGASRLGGRAAPTPPAGTATETARVPPAAPPTLAARPESARAATAPEAARPSTPADVPAGWERRGIGRITLVVPQGWLERPGPGPGSATWERPDEEERKAIAFGVLPKDVVASWKDRGESVASNDLAVDGHPARREEFTQRDRTGVIVEFAGDDASLPAVTFVMMGPKATRETDRPELDRILSSVRILPEPALVGLGGADQEPSVAYLDSLRGTIRGPRIEGVVLRGSQPQAGLSVRMRTAAPGPPQGARSTVTDGSGSFAFENVSRGTCLVEVTATGETEVATRISLVPDGQSRRLLLMLGTASIEGFAYDRLGRPAAGRDVEASGEAEKYQDTYGAVVRDDGSYRIGSLPAGHWSLGLYLPTGREFLADVRGATADLRWGETKRVDLGAPTPEPTLRGRVRSAGGTPLVGPGVYLTFEFMGRDEMLGGPLDAEGRFERRMPSGDYLGKVQGLAFSHAIDFRVTLDEKDVDSDVTVPGSSLRGRVLDLATGRPAAPGTWNAVVLLEPTAGGDPWMIAAAPDGTFAAFGVPAGSYRLHAELGPPATPRRSESQRIDVADGRDVGDLRLELPAK